MAVDRSRRRAAAGRDALLLALEVDAAIRRAFAQRNAEFLFAIADDVLGTVEPARDVGAQRNVVAADRTGLQHRIEGGDLVGPDRLDADVARHCGDQFITEPALVLLLRGKK